jgi:hypothetical protein
MLNPIILRGNNGVADLNAQIKQKQSEGYGAISVLYVHNSIPFVLMFEGEAPLEYELVEVSQFNMGDISALFGEYESRGYSIDKIETGNNVAFILFSKTLLTDN